MVTRNSNTKFDLTTDLMDEHTSVLPYLSATHEFVLTLSKMILGNFMNDCNICSNYLCEVRHGASGRLHVEKGSKSNLPILI